MDGCFTVKNFFLAAGVLIITLVICEGIGQ
jgi:hypothetical protein